jgi:MFS family permease
MAAGFGQFGAVASLAEVARHFGHAVSGTSFRDVVGLSGSTLSVGLAVLRLSSLLALPLASLADHWGRKSVLSRVAIAGLAVTAIASASPSYWTFVALFAVARPLLSATTTVVQVVVVELSDARQRVHNLMWISGGAGVGAGVSAVLHGLIPGANGFRFLFACAIVPALFVPWLIRQFPEPPASHRSDNHLRLGRLPRVLHRRMTVVAILVIVAAIITGPANGFAFVYGESVLGISRHEVALVVVLSAFTGIVGLVAGRYCADHFGRRPTVAVGVLATAATSVFAYSGGASRFVFGYMIGVLAAGALAPAAAALTTEVFPAAYRATAQGWVVVFGVVGAVAGILVFGWLGDVTHAAVTANQLRVPALLTFLVPLPLLGLLGRLPETRGVTID